MWRRVGVRLLLAGVLGLTTFSAPVVAAETEYLLDSRSAVGGLSALRIPFTKELNGDLAVRPPGMGIQNGAVLEIRSPGGEVLFTTTLEGTVASVIRIRRPEQDKTDIAIVAAGGARGELDRSKINRCRRR